MYNVTVTWMDGTEEIYRCGEHTVRDGVLSLWQPKYPRTEDQNRFIPLAGVRIYTVDQP